MTNAQKHKQRFRLWEQGLIDKEIAYACKCHVNTISAWRKKHGLPSNNRLIFRRPELRAKLRAEYDKGLSEASIAAAVGVSQSTARRWRVWEGLPSNFPGRGKGHSKTDP